MDQVHAKRALLICFVHLGGDEASLTNLEVGNAVPGLVALDTTTWTWLQLDIPGPPSAPFIYSTLTLLQNTKLVVALGGDIYNTQLLCAVNHWQFK